MFLISESRGLEANGLDCCWDCYKSATNVFLGDLWAMHGDRSETNRINKTQ